MPSVTVISGWAHGIDAIRPLGFVLERSFEVQLLTGNDVLKSGGLPDTDYILTGSMGGLLAMELLPESCEKLVLISSTARFCAGENHLCGTHEKILKRMIAQFRQDPDAVLEAFYQNVHHPHSVVATDPGASSEDLAAGLQYLLRTDLRDRIKDIEIPTLLLHGTEDRIIPHQASDWLHANLSDSRLVKYEGQGHALLAHAFKEAFAEIVDFLT